MCVGYFDELIGVSDIYWLDDDKSALLNTLRRLLKKVPTHFCQSQVHDLKANFLANSLGCC